MRARVLMNRTQTDDQPDGVDDPILRRVLSESAYDRVRIERFSHFKQPIHQKLLVQCVLLAALTLVLPLYALFPSDAAAYVPTMDPGVASPIALVVGLFALVLELGTALLLIGVALYRVREAPLTEDQAISLFTTETFATYLGFGTGGLTTAITLGLLGLGLGGEATLGTFVETLGGGNPFEPSHLGVSIAAFATAALTCALFVTLARAYVERRVATLE